MPNPGEGLPSRVPGKLPGGNRRTGHLLHPPPQQTQEIHLPVHRRLLFCPGSGESGQVRLYKVFLIKKQNRKENPRDNLCRFSPSQICSVFPPPTQPNPPLIPVIQGANRSLHNPATTPAFQITLENKRNN